MSDLLPDPKTGNLSLGKLDISNSGVKDLRSVVKSHRQVQVLNIGGNKIKSLRALAELRDLVWLDASHNDLSLVLDFETPSCHQGESDPYQSANAWTTGALWIGSNLEFANLSYNKIQSLSSMNWHCNLRCLDVSNNDIKRVGDLSTLEYLEELNLSNNKLAGLRATGVLPSLKVLSVNGNAFTDFRGFEQYPKLRYLSCCDNKIETFKGLESCGLLEEVNARGNRVSKMSHVEPLQGLRMLCSLNIEQNPVDTEKESFTVFRYRIIFRLSQLSVLNDIPISPEDKVRARCFYGADLEQRKAAFAGIFPGEEFLSVVDPYEDLEIVQANLAPELASTTVGATINHACSSVLYQPPYAARIVVSEVMSDALSNQD